MEKDCCSCKFELYNADENPCIDCGIDDRDYWKPKPQTNGDRVRAKSDEELAKVFTATVANGCPPQMDWDCAKDKNGWDACDACWCNWLQQAAEEVSSDA